MTKLEWDRPDARILESGIDRGVLFVDDNEGVPWNGLLGFKSRSTGAEAKPVYIDGVKANNYAGVEEFLGTLEAYYYPRQFEVCDGVGTDPEGVLGIGQQPRKPFHLAYRTWVDSAVYQEERGYKIHLLYNLYALPSNKTFQTRKDTTELTPFSWDILSTPVDVPGFLPTSHLVFESNKLYLRSLNRLEEIIFGSISVEARMPTPAEVVQIVGDFLPVMINQNTNMVMKPNPPAYLGSGWGVSSALPKVDDWFVSNVTVLTTPYVFTSGADEAVSVGDKVTMAVTFRVDACDTPTLTHIRVTPHRRSTNTYFFDGAAQIVPIQLGVETRVVFEWTVTAAMVAGDLDIALVGATAVGGFMSSSSIQWRVKHPVIDRGSTDGVYMPQGLSTHEVLGLRDSRLEGDLVGMRNGMYYRPSSTRLVETATDGLFTLEA